jgi:hypothetical protein
MREVKNVFEGLIMVKNGRGAKKRVETLAQIDLAVKTILESGQKVTVNEISQLTGLTKQAIYYYSEISKYVDIKKYKGKEVTKIDAKNIGASIVEPNKKDLLEQTLEAYIDYIKDTCFSRPIEVESVMHECRDSIGNFNQSIFHLAVNKLQLDKILKSTIYPFKYVIDSSVTATEEATKTVPVPAVEALPVVEHVEKIANDVVEQEPTLMEYHFPLSKGNVLYFKYQSNLTREDKETIIDVLELVKKRLSR